MDLEHSSLRAAAGSILVFSWILVIPGGLVTLEPFCAGVFLSAHIAGTLVLIAGMALDNVFFSPDKYITKADTPTACACYISRTRGLLCYSSKRGVFGGWVMTSHAWWHVIALISTICNSIGVEVIVATSDVLSKAA